MTAGLAVTGALLAAAAALAPFDGPAPRWWTRRQEDRVGAELPLLLDEIARSMRAGLSMRSALAAAQASLTGPLAGDVGVMVASPDSAETVLDDWADHRHRVPGVRLVAAALSMADRTGAAARALDGVADTLRADRELAAEVRALSSQAQVSALLIAVLPVGFALVASGADPSTLRFLVDSPVGRLCLIAGLGLDAWALWWMRRIVGAIR